MNVFLIAFAVARGCQGTLGREELLLKCVMCTLRAFVCIKCCTDAPEEEAKAHPSNTAEGRGRGVKTLMNARVLLHSRLRCGDRAAITGAAHNESLQDGSAQKQARAHARAHTNTHTVRFGKRATGPCWLSEEVTECRTHSVALDSIILSLGCVYWLLAESPHVVAIHCYFQYKWGYSEKNLFECEWCLT